MVKFRSAGLALMILLLLAMPAALAARKAGPPAMGPLRVCPENPRYFMRPDGKAVLLAGSHTWSVLQDMGREYPPRPFDFDAYLDWVCGYGHNFIRGWRFEFGRMDKPDGLPYTLWVAPQPWARTGPGTALDGKPKYNLKLYDEAYFKLLRSRLLAAQKRGVYVSVMFFCGWGTSVDRTGWRNHPFNPANSVDGINGDPSGDGLGGETHTLAMPELTRIQEAYIRKVIDTVNDLDNVLYEVCNETPEQIDGHSSNDWQYRMIRFIKEYEKRKPKQHPVGMTCHLSLHRANRDLFASPADWVSPSGLDGYNNDPPASDGRKVILSDTDHILRIEDDARWVWQSFMRGLNPIYMDPYDGVVLGERFDPAMDPARRNMGYALRFSRRVNMNKMVPHGELASTCYCLADLGSEYLVYLPGGNEATVDCKSLKGRSRIEWFDPGTGKVRTESRGIPDGRNKFVSPFGKSDALLLIKSGH